MNLEQFEPEARERIQEHQAKYYTGKLIPGEDNLDEVEKEVLHIRAETLKEAHAIVETAVLVGDYSAFVPGCGCGHDCCACISTSSRQLARIDKWSFIAIHSFIINI